RLRGTHPLGNVLAQSRLRGGNLERHAVEGAAQPSELVGPSEVTSSIEISSGEFFRCAHQLRRAPGQKEMKYQPHRQSEHRHPAGPVERLLKNLCSSLRLVPLKIVAQEDGAGPGRTERVAFTAHQNAGVAEQFAAIRVGGHSSTAFSN